MLLQFVFCELNTKCLISRSDTMHTSIQTNGPTLVDTAWAHRNMVG